MVIWLVAFAAAFYLGWRGIDKWWLLIAPVIGTIAAVGSVNRMMDLRSELGLAPVGDNVMIGALVMVAVATAIMFGIYFIGQTMRERREDA